MPAGRGGALSRSSASNSFEQIGHFTVMRLWRQNSDVMGFTETLAAPRGRRVKAPA
jgi:hypothetical protein